MLKGNDIYNPIKSEIYLRDQSNLSGNAEAIAFVTTSDEAIKALQFAREQNKTVTIRESDRSKRWCRSMVDTLLISHV